MAIARRLFADKGFAGTSIEEIVAQAQMTRGALYHHFDGKTGLFQAVFLRLHQETGARILAAASRHAGVFDSLRAGCRAFLVAAAEPTFRQIVLIDAPAVLGQDVWRLADEENAVHLLRAGLAELAAAERLPFDPEAATALVNGALNEAALFIARADDPAAALARSLDVFDRLLAGLRRP